MTTRDSHTGSHRQHHLSDQVSANTPKVLAWLARHPRWTFHFTPTSASRLNAVETPATGKFDPKPPLIARETSTSRLGHLEDRDAGPPQFSWQRLDFSQVYRRLGSAPAYCIERFVERRENPRLADHCRDAMAVHVGP